MNLSWDKPPLVMAITGDERFLRRRWLHHVTRGAFQAGYEVVHAGSDGEVVTALSMTAAFGQPTLVLVDGDKVDLETVKTHLADKPKQVCIVMEVDGEVNPKKHPSVALVKKAHTVSYNAPVKRRDRERLAEKHLLLESHRAMGSKDALSPQLATAMVGAVGTDLGVLGYEIGKVTALVRSRGGHKINPADVRAVLRGSSEANMQPLRDALARADGVGVAKALSAIRRKSPTDPTMLLLRARGAPADLAYQWLQTSLMLSKGKPVAEIASVLGSPLWAVERTTVPAAKKWGTRNLVSLVRDLSAVDLGVFRGVPAPWVACEAALLRGCSSVPA